MPTIDLGRIKPIWQGQWAGSTAYVKDDIVRYGVDSYICVTAHTSDASTFSNDSANWELMTQGSDIPTQSGQSGKVLKTDGSTLSWGDGSKAGSVAFGAYVTSDYGTTSSVWTKMEAQNEQTDIGNCYDAANARFTAPETGLYFFSARVLITDMTSNGDKCWVRFYVNNSPGPQYCETRWGGWAAVNDELTAHASSVLELQANSYVEFWFYQNAGGRSVRGGLSGWSGYRIS